jgi:DNA-binding transcriptional regulator LsrR (DeoR family)
MRKKEALKLVEICRLYYEKELTQAQIAKTFDISRPAVSKLLSEARHRGIVKIEIRSPFDSDDDLMNQLIRLFNLKGGLIIPSATKDEGLIRRLIVSQGALYLEKIFPDIKKLGIGWGKTIGDLIEEFQNQIPNESEKSAICPVIGSAPNAIQWLQTNELTRILARKINFPPYYLHAPAFPFSEKDKQLFMNTIEYQKISELWTQLDTILVGVGTYPTVPDQATAVRFGDKLKKKKAVGVLATYYYDLDGNIIRSPNDIVVRIPLKYLKNTKRVVVISGSPKKIRALRGALMTGLVSYLITDERTARELIKFHQELI